MSLSDYFFSPFLRAPIFGSLFMCVSVSLMGVVLYLRRQTMVSETLSHATYPGVVAGVFAMALFMPEASSELTFCALFVGAFLFAYLSLKSVAFLEKRGGVKSDAAQCFVLAVFFGLGLVLATALQGFFPIRYKDVIHLLLGQVATMGDSYIAIYGALSLLIALFLILFYRPLQALLFDASYAKSAGLKIDLLERLLFSLLVIAIIVSLKSVGVILMSGMLVAPAVAARCFTDRMPKLFLLSALFGGASAVLGNVLAIESAFSAQSLPTGPMIVLVSSLFALLSLLVAPHRGIVFRWLRQRRFSRRCVEENILKAVWKRGVLLAPLKGAKRLVRQGWLACKNGGYVLTVDGEAKALRIVRLHRLWELYLTEAVGVKAQDVHRHAEEMEHLLTPEIEEKLTQLLSNPKRDPHAQPIPERVR